MKFKKMSAMCCMAILFFWGVMHHAPLRGDENDVREEMVLSAEANVIVSAALQKLVTTMADISGAEGFEEDNTWRHRQVFDCLQEWKGKAISVGSFYDQSIKDGQKLEFPNVYNDTRHVSFGYREGKRLMLELLGDVLREITKNRIDHLVALKELKKQQPPPQDEIDKMEKPLTRDEIIRSHPHVEAFIYLSRMLKAEKANDDEK